MSDDLHDHEVLPLDEVETAEDLLANIPSGEYFIHNKKAYAGRNHIEDHSLLPKKIHCPTDGHKEAWRVERLPNGRYKISARGDPTDDINKLLYALLIDKVKAQEWIIRRREQIDKHNVYTIQKATGEGWVRQLVSDVKDPQVAVRHLRATKSLPPHFEGGALWSFQPFILSEGSEA